MGPSDLSFLFLVFLFYFFFSFKRSPGLRLDNAVLEGGHFDSIMMIEFATLSIYVLES